ncbi:MAG: hypothetical protein M1826_002682 [Phylliscum demangeonii]|nr:MAG: hypothetical protein M1826_002682 [Phylliscum demangeonii]
MRGQGLNISGNPLQPLLMEAIFSPGVAVLIDCETESKARTLQEVRIIIKKYGGTGTPTSHMFKKRGRIIFESDERGLTMDDLLDDAVESGAEDVDSDEDGHIVIYTEPSKTISTAAALAQKRALKIRSSDIMWEARSETAVVMDSEASLKTLVGFMDDVLEEPSVQGTPKYGLN